MLKASPAQTPVLWRSLGASGQQVLPKPSSAMGISLPCEELGAASCSTPPASRVEGAGVGGLCPCSTLSQAGILSPTACARGWWEGTHVA